ncbi:MAG: 2OG-Fe(II) oxygenase [Pseudoxanthomonas sp.]
MSEQIADADLIGVFADALDAATCAAIVERFEASGQAVPGRVGGGLHPELKRSSDIRISGRPGWSDVEQQLDQAMLRALLGYVRRWPYTLIAPVMRQRAGADGRHRPLAGDDVAAMDDAELGRLLMAAFRPGLISLQRYRAGEGGYPYWHCGLFPRDPHAETLHRHLLWTLYLNDGFGGGETEFFHQRRKVVPRTGQLLLAPAAFTHTHRGNRPQRADQYLATGWVLFQSAARLYGGG